MPFIHRLGLYIIFQTFAIHCYVLFELQVRDELLYINGVSTVGMSRSDAITLIKQGGDVVKLIIPRVIKQLAV